VEILERAAVISFLVLAVFLAAREGYLPSPPQVGIPFLTAAESELIAEFRSDFGRTEARLSFIDTPWAALLLFAVRLYVYLRLPIFHLSKLYSLVQGQKKPGGRIKTLCIGVEATAKFKIILRFAQPRLLA
jgi:hypothetical protein